MISSKEHLVNFRIFEEVSYAPLRAAAMHGYGFELTRIPLTDQDSLDEPCHSSHANSPIHWFTLRSLIHCVFRHLMDGPDLSMTSLTHQGLWQGRLGAPFQAAARFGRGVCRLLLRDRRRAVVLGVRRLPRPEGGGLASYAFVRAPWIFTPARFVRGGGPACASKQCCVSAPFPRLLSQSHPQIHPWLSSGVRARHVAHGKVLEEST